MVEQLASWVLGSPIYFNVFGTNQLSVKITEAAAVLTTVLLGNMRSFVEIPSQKPAKQNRYVCIYLFYNAYYNPLQSEKILSNIEHKTNKRKT